MFEQNTRRATGEQSPSEKLQDYNPTGLHVPGTEKPESEEIKREINPNTE